MSECRCFNKTTEIRSFKVYPRVYYFKRRLQELLPRFHRIKDVFPECFQDKAWLAKIKENNDKFSNPPNIIVIGESDLEKSRLIVADHADEDTGKHIRDGGIFNVFVCYINLEHCDVDEGIKIIQKHIENLCSELQNEDEPFERLLVMCDTHSSDDTVNQRIRECILGYLLKHYPVWSKDDRIIIGPDNVTLSSKISELLEGCLSDTFLLVFDYLSRFMRIGHPALNTTDTDLKEIVVTALQSITRNFVALHDLKIFSDFRETQRLPTSSEKPITFVDEVVNSLVVSVRCALVKPFADTYQLPINICYLIVREFDFDTKLANSISNTTRSKLHRLEVKDVERDSKRGDCSKHDYIVTSLAEDMASAIQEFQKHFSKARDCITIMGKLQFEIKGYLRQTTAVIRKTMPVTRTVLPKDLSKDILCLEFVYGVGVVYDKLEIHVKTLDSSVQSSIKSLIKQHKYAQPYSIQKVCESK